MHPRRNRVRACVPERSRPPDRPQKQRIGSRLGRVHAPVEGGGHFSANVWRPHHPTNASRQRSSPTTADISDHRPDTGSRTPPTQQPRHSGTQPQTARNATRHGPTSSLAGIPARPVSTRRLIVRGRVSERSCAFLGFRSLGSMGYQGTCLVDRSREWCRSPIGPDCEGG